VQGGRGREGFDAMSVAYVRFALAHPSHYRVMFGGFLDACAADPKLVQESSAAFQVLVEAVVALQQEGRVRREDPLQLSRFIWAIVHGIAMLAIDGQLRRSDTNPDTLIRYAIERVRTGIAPAGAS
jgi:AcrR family transcriptional regulator